MSVERKTGIHVAPAPQKDDYSEFLTGDALQDRKRVSMLLETIAEVSANVDVEAVKQSVARKSVALTGAERAIVMLFDEQNVLRIELAVDAAGRDLGKNLQYSHSVAMRVARDGRGICLIDTANSGEISLGQSILDLKLLTVMCVPLRVKDRLLGLIYVDSKASSKEFKDRDLTLFKALAGQVAVAIDSARLLKHYIEKQRIQEELAVAQKIQMSLLPKGALHVPGLDVHGVSLSCEETGGDYFDYLRRSGGRVGFAVGDVSGHGVGAALLMSTARALLRAFASTDAPPHDVVTRMNRFLSQDVETGRFMTLFYGEMDIREKKLTYVRAGHNEPMIYRRATDSFESLAEGGIALAMMDDFDFESSGPVSLSPGDVLCMYTDGVVETMNAAREVFGEERLQGVLRRSASKTAKEIVTDVLAAVREFSGTDRREDDVTLVLARMTG